jgi:DNA-directed RNA polymerase subunit RPC12/RpoP
MLLASRHQTLFDEPAGEPTLDDLLAGVWEVLTGGRAVRCPVCGGAMEAASGRGAPEIVGRCGHCGSTLT